MSSDAWWWVALGLGLVVAVVAVVLLELLYRQVRRIERGAEQIWHTGKQVAANTSTTWMLDQVGDDLEALVEEAGRHDELLGRGR